MPDMTRNAFTVAVVGATGVVGRTMIQVLLEREFPVGDLRLLASERSAGRTVSIRPVRTPAFIRITRSRHMVSQVAVPSSRPGRNGSIRCR